MTKVWITLFPKLHGNQNSIVQAKDSFRFSFSSETNYVAYLKLKANNDMDKLEPSTLHIQ